MQAEILELIYKLKRSEYRGEQAEMNIQRLNVRIDQVFSYICHTLTFNFQPNICLFVILNCFQKQVEEDLLSEKYKIKKWGLKFNFKNITFSHHLQITIIVTTGDQSIVV